MPSRNESHSLHHTSDDSHTSDVMQPYNISDISHHTSDVTQPYDNSNISHTSDIEEQNIDQLRSVQDEDQIGIEDGDNGIKLIEKNNVLEKIQEMSRHMDLNDGSPVLERKYNPSICIQRLSNFDVTLYQTIPENPLYQSTPKRRMSSRVKLVPSRLTYR